VKYHLGASSDREFDGQRRAPVADRRTRSHLEIVDPGGARQGPRASRTSARLTRPERDRRMVLPLLIHGDAAFAGQGVVAECLGLLGPQGLPHRRLHPLHHQQPDRLHHRRRRYSRSSPYPTDVAKMVEAPIFHVNGDDPEAVVYAAKVAVEFRQKLQKPTS